MVKSCPIAEWSGIWMPFEYWTKFSLYSDHHLNTGYLNTGQVHHCITFFWLFCRSRQAIVFWRATRCAVSTASSCQNFSTSGYILLALFHRGGHGFFSVELFFLRVAPTGPQACSHIIGYIPSPIGSLLAIAPTHILEWHYILSKLCLASVAELSWAYSRVFHHVFGVKISPC